MVDIEKYLLPKIRARWGDQPIEDARGTEYKAIFRAKHPEVGEICVSDEREEITIFVGTIAHQHFYDRGWPEEEFQYSSEDDYADKISDEAVEWLEQVFADEVWFSRGLMVSSIGYRGPGQRGFLRRLLFPVQRYVWSGPLDE